MRSKTSPRTYNQVEVPRPYTPSKRRFSIYWTWSYPWESNRDVTEMDNRFSTITEVRRVAWPAYETAEYSARSFLQGIAGTLELFHLSLLRFQQLVGELTGQPVAVYQRVDQAGQTLPIDAGILDDTDTLMVFGLDHLVTEQEAATEEIEALREWLKGEGTWLILGPRHDGGVSNDLKERAMEYAHNRDPLVPRQQRFGQYTRSVMKGLGVPVHNQYGLRPATVQGTTQLQPLVKHSDLDARGWLEGVQTFNFHPHLPHYAITATDASAIHLLAQQPIDLSRPHPFTEAVIASSTCSCGCRRRGTAPATSCWRIRRSSRRCSGATKASTGSGRTSRQSDAATESACRNAGRLPAAGSGRCARA